MRIALDFDNTVTRDPMMWGEFYRLALSHGHEVKIVTSRHPGCPVPDWVVGIDVVYCSFTAKRKHYDADVWIDDDPKHIELDHDLNQLYGGVYTAPVDHHPV